ncbi:MAG: nucleotidyltransferase domain-containing protein [Acidobacteriota bacterium]
MEETLNRLVKDLENACEDKLVSIVLYGSAASGEYHARSSDLNVLCVLTEIRADLLRRVERAIHWFQLKGNPPPLLFTIEEIKDGSDVFPIEFLDMRENHRVLKGRDVLVDLEIHRENHRLELEHELRTKYLGLRQNYLATGHRSQAISDLICRSLPAFITFFRHILLLMGEKVSLNKHEVLRVFCAKAGLDEPLFLELLSARESGKVVPEADSRFARYLEELAKTIRLVDRLPKS